MARTRKPPTEPGFRVAGTSMFIPLVPSSKFKQGDVKLIEAVTNKDWKAFAKIVAKNGLNHPLALQGFFAVAVKRQLGLDDDGVVEFIDDLPLSTGIELVFPKTEDEASPPAPASTQD